MQTSGLSLYSVIQCYFINATRIGKLVYNRAPPNEVTPLFGRMFGTWNLLSTIVRVCAAYDIHHRGMYLLALLTYVIALLHFAWEVGIAKTAGGPSLLAAEITPIVLVTWMLWSWEEYVG